MTGSTILSEQISADVDAASIDDPEHSNETLEIRRFRQHLLHCLGRNYYDTKTCPWITLVFCFMCIQILEATVLIFLPLAVWRNSAVEALAVGSILIFFITPTSTYFLFFTRSFSQQKQFLNSIITHRQTAYRGNFALA